MAIKGKGKGKGKSAPPPPPPGPMAAPAAGGGGGGGGGVAELAAMRARLASTETWVRARDGSVTVERRGDDGAPTVTRAEAAGPNAKPQYQLDMEAGFSRLVPRCYDSASARWQADVVGGPRSVAGAAADAATRNAAALGAGGLRLVTYNVWFSERNQAARATALLGLLERMGEVADGGMPHVVCLQEVTPFFLTALKKERWVQAQYVLSDSVGTTLIGSTFPYGVVMLLHIVRPPLPPFPCTWLTQLMVRSQSLHISSLTLHDLPSNMGRKLLCATLPLPGGEGGGDDHELRLGTAHLESMDNAPIRAAQLEVAWGALGVVAAVAKPKAGDEPAAEAKFGRLGLEAVLCGDMNFCASWAENAVLPLASILVTGPKIPHESSISLLDRS